MNEIVKTTDKTPIEVALEVDSDGWTTAKKLYDWLGLDPTNYSKWINERILNNPYVDEMEFSYLGTKTSEKGGRPTEDYAISGDLAKMIAISSKSEKGIAVRKYYNKLEDALKITVKQYNMLEQQLANLQNYIEKVDTRMAYLESGVSDPSGRKSEWIKETSKDVLELAECLSIPPKEMYSRILDRMDEMYGTDFKNSYKEYLACHPNERSVWRIIVIEYYNLQNEFEDAMIEIGRECGLYNKSLFDDMDCFEKEEW